MRSFLQVETPIHDSFLHTISQSPGVSPLHVALYFGLGNSVKAILEDGMDPNTSDADGLTALHKSRDKQMTSMLLERGATVDLRDIQLRTPLMNSAWRGDDHVMRALLQHDAYIKRMEPFRYDILQEAVLATWRRYQHDGLIRI